MVKHIGGMIFPGKETVKKKKEGKENGPRNCVRPVPSLSGLKRRPSVAERLYHFFFVK